MCCEQWIIIGLWHVECEEWKANLMGFSCVINSRKIMILNFYKMVEHSEKERPLKKGSTACANRWEGSRMCDSWSLKVEPAQSLWKEGQFARAIKDIYVHSASQQNPIALCFNCPWTRHCSARSGQEKNLPQTDPLLQELHYGALHYFYSDIKNMLFEFT